MFLKIGIFLVIVAASIVLYASTRPDTFVLERSIEINAPAEKIFPLINNLRSWAAWSPYENLDPNMKKTFSGLPLGRGAVYTWEGDSKVGAGKTTIIDSNPPRSVKINLDMSRPFECHNLVEFTLIPQGSGTLVTWSMSGPVTLMGKVMGFLFSDNMVKGQFDDGLSKMKAVVEK